MAIHDERADAYTRHLYAGDASMYASPPLSVAFPRDAADVAAAIRVAAERGVPVVTRGAGTSLAGQTAGQGIVLDTSRHMDEIHAIDVERPHRAGRARRRPGRAQRRRQAARPRLRPRHLDLQPGHARRHDRQQLLGQPLDRLRHDDRPRAASWRWCCPTARRPPSARCEGARPACPGRTRSRAASYRGLPEILREHARAIAEDYPHHWRQSGGYRLDSLAREFDLAKFVTGSEGTLVAITEATVEPDRAAEGAAVRRRPLPLRRRGGRRHPGRARPQCGGDRDDRRDDPRAVALQARVRADGEHDRGRPGRAAVRHVLRRHARRGRRAARPPAGGVARARPRLPLPARRDRRRAGRADQGPQGRPRAADGRQRGRQAPRRVRRGHRGRARAPRRLRQGVPRDPRAPRAQRRLLRPLQRRLPAHPPVRRPQRRRAASRRWPPSPTRSPRWWRSSTA